MLQLSPKLPTLSHILRQTVFLVDSGWLLLLPLDAIYPEVSVPLETVSGGGRLGL